MRVRDITIGVKLGLALPTAAWAHASEQGFVLLLPTGAYTAAGVAVVVLTILALVFLPAKATHTFFAHRPLTTPDLSRAKDITSALSFTIMGFAIYLGLFGPRDPLSNLMPLGFWTLGWMLIVSLSGLVGNLWDWINPWRWIVALLGSGKPMQHLPSGLGYWPAILLLIGFAAFLLADIAPDDPTRLARFAALYWAAMLAGLLIFGQVWLTRVELGHAVFSSYAQLAPLNARGIGGPGWALVTQGPSRAAGLFALTLLAVGSFDGLNETFWWLGLIGVNPLEFPGRSAVIAQTLAGLLAAIAGLTLIMALVVWAGLRLAQIKTSFTHAFNWLALSLLPIALAYHIAHYLTSFLVNIQYSIAALSDPFALGWDLLGIEPFRVTTGFFNRIDSVRLIWLTQAGAVVLGHVWSVLLSHRIALKLAPDNRRALLLTAPLSGLMIGYTFLGLWLLAAPKGG